MQKLRCGNFPRYIRESLHPGAGNNYKRQTQQCIMIYKSCFRKEEDRGGKRRKKNNRKRKRERKSCVNVKKSRRSCIVELNLLDVFSLKTRRESLARPR